MNGWPAMLCAVAVYLIVEATVPAVTVVDHRPLESVVPLELARLLTSESVGAPLWAWPPELATNSGVIVKATLASGPQS